MKKYIENLRKKLHKANFDYYVNNKSEISDFEFDNLMKELIELEKKHTDFYDENSPSMRIGSDINKDFKQIKHNNKMFSLGNTYSKEELIDFDNRIKKLLHEENYEYVCELKFDGTAISLIYENGNLKQAITRGDGNYGDDVTENVRTIKTIPMVLDGNDFPEKFEIRGEIMMTHKVFHKLNKERAEINKSVFANPRNAASGSLKMRNSYKLSLRRLNCFLYDVRGENLPSKFHFENIQMAKKWNFKTSKNTKIAKNINEVFNFIEYWDKERENLNFDIDGIVIKLNSIEQQENLGFTSKVPRWAISYKFKAERISTILLSIDYQVGRTGAITPVANLKSVLLAGTIVKRASLHNANIMKNLDVKINDRVFVEKGGEIIPKIIAVDFEYRQKNLDKIKDANYIENCPECKTPLIRKDGEAKHYCPNKYSCTPQIKAKIEHFVLRKAMNIRIGKSTINLLLKNNLIKNISDFYILKENDLIGLERFAEKSASNLIKSIEKSKKVIFEKVLYAIGIPYVGETVSKKLVYNFKNIENLQKASFEELISIEDIGERIAISLINFFNDEQNLLVINNLKNYGLNFKIKEEMVNKEGKLSGKKIIISGTFENHSRSKLKSLIELNGGKNVTSISKNTSFLLAGTKIGPSKLKKVEKLNIPMVSEDEFINMIK